MISDILELITKSSELKLLILALVFTSLTALVIALIKARQYVKKDFFELFNRRRTIDETLAKVDDLVAVKRKVEELEGRLQALEDQLQLIIKTNQEGLNSGALIEVLKTHAEAFNKMTEELEQTKLLMIKMVQETIRKVR